MQARLRSMLELGSLGQWLGLERALFSRCITVTEESGRAAVAARLLSVARPGVHRVVWSNIS